MEPWQIAFIPVGVITAFALIVAGAVTLIMYVSPKRNRRRTVMHAPAPEGAGANYQTVITRVKSYALSGWGLLFLTVLFLTASGLFYSSYGVPGLIVLILLALAIYGARKGDGKGAIIFTRIVATVLLIAAFAILILGPDGAKRRYDAFQEAANTTLEDGIDFDGWFNGWTTTPQPPDATPTPVEVYDVFVPGRGCSEPAPNTNPKFWINPFPKDARTGWPNLTLVITPKTGNGWVPYKDTMRSYSFIRWCNSTGRNMWMTVEVYKGRL